MNPGNGNGVRFDAERLPDDDRTKGDLTVSSHARVARSIERPISTEHLQPRAFRGILIALLLSLPVWLLVIWAIVWYL